MLTSINQLELDSELPFMLDSFRLEKISAQHNCSALFAGYVKKFQLMRLRIPTIWKN
jgi:putative IMPACT (imprinted ancient) family translation regulator